MKMLSIIMLSAFCLLNAKDNTTYIKVDGMQCSYSCAGKVNSVVQKLDGVKNSTVDFAEGVATITYDGKKLDRSEIIASLKKNTRYSIEAVSAPQKAQYGGCGGNKANKAVKTEI